jgi:hypothetical protein
MSPQTENSAWARSGDRPQLRVYRGTDYSQYGDGELRDACEAQQWQLNGLALYGSPAMMQRRASIEYEVTSMTEELIRRARAKHPSSGGTASASPLRSLDWPPHLSSDH